MATDNGRIKAALNSVLSVGYRGLEKEAALDALRKLDGAEGRSRGAEIRREKARKKRSPDPVKTSDFLRCTADYQDAPLGTVIYKRFGSGWWRKVHDAWIDENGTVMPGAHIATAPREVRKWGDL